MVSDLVLLLTSDKRWPPCRKVKSLTIADLDILISKRNFTVTMSKQTVTCDLLLVDESTYSGTAKNLSWKFDESSLKTLAFTIAREKLWQVVKSQINQPPSFLLHHSIQGIQND